MSRLLRISLSVASALLMSSGGAFAQSISASGDPGLLRINSAIAGSQPISVSNATTTYTVVTPNPNRTYKITAQLNANMPTDVTLTVTLAAPTGATSLGAISLDVTARDVVTGVPRQTDATRSITYQLSALVTAGVIPSSTRIVTLTVVRTP
jgi:hypothetical protein